MPKAKKTSHSNFDKARGINPWHPQYWARWLGLKKDPEYSKAVDGLQQVEGELEQARKKVERAYKFFEAKDTTKRREACLSADKTHRKIRDQCEALKEKVCKQFGLLEVFSPDNPTITAENAWTVFTFNPFPVQALDLGSIKRRLLQQNYRPPQSAAFSKATKDGKLLLEVDLTSSLELVDPQIHLLLRLHRRGLALSNQRNRPTKDLEALKVFEMYDQLRNFVNVAKEAKLPLSTIKDRFVRGFVLVYGKPPDSSTKKRRAFIKGDPAQEFQVHLPKCNQCRNATSADNFCPKFLGFLSEVHKGQQEIPTDPRTLHRGINPWH